MGSSLAAWAGGSTYLFGGGLGWYSDSLAVQRYDATNDSLETLEARLPYPISGAAIVSTGRLIYLFGGSDWTGPGSRVDHDQIIEFDTENASLRVLPHRLPTALHDSSAIWDGSHVYIFGGVQPPSKESTVILRWDPSTGFFSTMGERLPEECVFSNAIWTGTYAYLASHYNNFEGAECAGNEIFRYNPATDSLIRVAAQLPVMSHTGDSIVWMPPYAYIFFRMDGRGNQSVNQSKVLRYHPATDTLVELDDPMTRWSSVAAVSDGHVADLFGGASRGDAAFPRGLSDRIRRFDPRQDHAPVARFALTDPYVVQQSPAQFADESTDEHGILVRWDWNFGDGTTSNQRHPVHMFAKPGAYLVRLTVTDEGSQTSTATQTIQALASHPPNVTILHTPEEPTWQDKVQLTGSATDIDGEARSWRWDFGDGAAADGPTTTHRFPHSGNFTVQLHVTDDTGVTGTGTHSVVVYDPGYERPTPEFAWEPANPTTLTPIQFLDRSVDPQGRIFAYQWKFGDGETTHERNPQHQYVEPGTYTVKLHLYEAGGRQTVRDHVLTVAPPDVVFTMYPGHPRTHELVRFEDASPNATTVVARHWDFGDGGESAEIQPSHTFGNWGPFDVTLTLTKQDGTQISLTRRVDVRSLKPVADFVLLPYAPTTADTILFLDNSTDPDGRILSWEWDLGSGTSPSGQNVTHRFLAEGTYAVRLLVRDDAGESHEITKSFVVLPGRTQPPVADFNARPDPATRSRIQFTDQSADSDGSVIWWRWDFGDGTLHEVSVPASGLDVHPIHVYPSPGPWTVTLTVRDNLAATVTVQRQIEVQGVVPVASFQLSPTSTRPGEEVVFQEASDDPDGTVARWSWSFGDGASSTEANPRHAYASAGTYSVRLVVTDADGYTASATTTLTVAEAAPTSSGPPTGSDTPTVGLLGLVLCLFVLMRAVGNRRPRP